MKDWLSDPELQCVAASSRGIWIDALCYMWEAPERGKLTGTIEEMSKLLRATNGDFTQFLKDVEKHRFADVTTSECLNLLGCDAIVTNRDIEMTIINRRMFRETKFKENHALRQEKYRERQKSDTKMTPPSSSSSPSPTPKNKDIARSDKPKRALSLADIDFIQALKENPAYKGIDIDREIGKLDAWFLTPRGRGKYKTRQRVVNWLNRVEKPMEIEKFVEKDYPKFSSNPREDYEQP